MAYKNGVEYLESWGVPDPDAMGAGEYRAIHDFLADALNGCEEEVADEPIDFAVAMVDEFIAHAQAIKERLKQQQGGTRAACATDLRCRVHARKKEKTENA